MEQGVGVAAEAAAAEAERPGADGFEARRAMGLLQAQHALGGAEVDQDRVAEQGRDLFAPGFQRGILSQALSAIAPTYAR
jgi:hypothetical protein